MELTGLRRKLLRAKSMANELIDIVDKSGKVLRQIMKSQAHKDGSLHKTVIGYVRDGDNWTLVRQASDKQDAGQLVAPVGGHVEAGETEIEALKREAMEEIGADNITYTLKGRAIFERYVIGRHENHYFIVFEISTDEPLVLNHESVATETFTKQELKDALKNRPQDFGDAFYFVLESFYKEYLPEDREMIYAQD